MVHIMQRLQGIGRSVQNYFGFGQLYLYSKQIIDDTVNATKVSVKKEFEFLSTPPILGNNSPYFFQKYLKVIWMSGTESLIKGGWDISLKVEEREIISTINNLVSRLKNPEEPLNDLQQWLVNEFDNNENNMESIKAKLISENNAIKQYLNEFIEQKYQFTTEDNREILKQDLKNIELVEIVKKICDGKDIEKISSTASPSRFLLDIKVIALIVIPFFIGLPLFFLVGIIDVIQYAIFQVFGHMSEGLANDSKIKRSLEKIALDLLESSKLQDQLTALINAQLTALMNNDDIIGQLSNVVKDQLAGIMADESTQQQLTELINDQLTTLMANEEIIGQLSNVVKDQLARIMADETTQQQLTELINAQLTALMNNDDIIGQLSNVVKDQLAGIMADETTQQQLTELIKDQLTTLMANEEIIGQLSEVVKGQLAGIMADETTQQQLTELINDQLTTLMANEEIIGQLSNVVKDQLARIMADETTQQQLTKLIKDQLATLMANEEIIGQLSEVVKGQLAGIMANEEIKGQLSNVVKDQLAGIMADERTQQQLTELINQQLITHLTNATLPTDSEGEATALSNALKGLIGTQLNAQMPSGQTLVKGAIPVTAITSILAVLANRLRAK